MRSDSGYGRMISIFRLNFEIRIEDCDWHEEPEPAKFLRGTLENFERKVKFLEYFFAPSRNKSVKNQRDPKPHISNINTVTFHFSHYEDWYHVVQYDIKIAQQKLMFPVNRCWSFFNIFYVIMSHISARHCTLMFIAFFRNKRKRDITAFILKRQPAKCPPLK